MNEEGKKSIFTWPDTDVTLWTINIIVGLPQQLDKSADSLFVLKLNLLNTGMEVGLPKILHNQILMILDPSL
jgi:hypothetical protein